MDAIHSVSIVSSGAQEYEKLSTKVNVENRQHVKSEFEKAVDNSAVFSKSKSFEPSEKENAAAAFEAMVISQFIGEILKEQSAGAFGSGAEGDFYSSVFADAISKQLTEAGTFGIAKLL
jgi:Rod binding domain-containing protein